MILPAFNRSALKVRLERIDNTRQLAFGALCCERLLPNYKAFQKDAAWGDTAVVRNALDCVWSFLYGKAISSEEVKNVTASCEAVAPNSNDFASLYVTAAQDACFAVCCLLDYMLENNVDKITQAATYATDSVDLYVQEIENMSPTDPQLESKILKHRLMQRELAQQQADLASIEQAQSVSGKLLDHLRESWKNNGKGNLDLPR